MITIDENDKGINAVARMYADQFVEAYNAGNATLVHVPWGHADSADAVLREVAEHLHGEGLPLDGLSAVVQIDYTQVKDGEPALVHPMAVDLADYVDPESGGADFNPIYRMFDTLKTFAHAPEVDDEEDEQYVELPEVEAPGRVEVEMVMSAARKGDKTMDELAVALREQVATRLDIELILVMVERIQVVAIEEDDLVLSCKVSLPGTLRPDQFSTILEVEGSDMSGEGLDDGGVTYENVTINADGSVERT